jgi:hypothetical protein
MVACHGSWGLLPWMRYVVVGVPGTACVKPPSTEAYNRENDGVHGRCAMKKQLGIREQGTGLMLVPRRVRHSQRERVIREGSTGRVVATLPNVLMLPRVWAVAEKIAAAEPELEPSGQPKVELAFYRKYTEGMLRRYLRLSMQSGRVPSLLGRELFRGNVTSYRVHGFEDAVIFCFDVEKRLGRLQVMDQQLIKRIALQEYTQGEAAGMLGLSLRNSIRQYGQALDRLTEMFLEAGMLEPLKSCQGGRGEEISRSASF